MIGKIFSGGNALFMIILTIFTGAMMFIFTMAWILIIPDLFPGAVEQGLVARSISWWTSFKLAVFLCLTRIGSGYKERSEERWSTMKRMREEEECRREAC